ncbi:MAG TPA: NAD(P)H-dependent oxidoreductase [Candidatus Saccharimonadia bacterium]|jgi:chromate reductase
MKLNITGIAGSLRSGSYNRAALRAAAELCPEEVEIQMVNLRDIPSYNEDRESNPPESVGELKRAIRACDAVLFATPEYNYSIPGVLKNAIDWASRPYGDSAWDDKPAAIMGASIGPIGTARAQYHLRQILSYLNMYAINKPEVLIANAAEKFDEQGHLIDQDTRDYIEALVMALVSWTERLKKAELITY